jgi:hypothetical protein
LSSSQAPLEVWGKTPIVVATIVANIATITMTSSNSTQFRPPSGRRFVIMIVVLCPLDASANVKGTQSTLPEPQVPDKSFDEVCKVGGGSVKTTAVL